MSISKISHRYALALLNISIENNALENVSKDIDFLSDTIKSSRDLQLVLKSPIIKTFKKVHIFQELFHGKFSNIFEKFLMLVINKRRENLLINILDEFQKLKDKHFGILKVNVKSAVNFSEEQTKKLKQVLETNTNKIVILNFILDKSLIGGFIVQIEDTILDASIKHQIEKLHQMFLFGSIESN